MARLTEMVLSGAQAVLAGGQMNREEVLAGAAGLNALPFHAVEILNPALSRTLVRQLAESPFERVRLLRKVLPTTPLLVSLDARCGLGEKQLDPEAFARLARTLAEAGIDRFRLTDPAQDVETIAPVVKELRACGKAIELLYSLSASQPASPDDVLSWYEKAGGTPDTAIVLSAVAGRLTPKTADKLVRALKAKDISVGISLSDRAGLAVATALAAVAAGADFIDTALSPFAGGTSFPATEVLVLALADAGLDTGLSESALQNAVEQASLARKRLVGLIARDGERVIPLTGDTALHPVPVAEKALSLAQIEADHEAVLKRPEDALLVAQFGEVGLALVKGEAKPKKPEVAGSRAYDVQVDGESYHVEVNPSLVGLVVKPKARPTARPAPRPVPAGGHTSPTHPTAKPAPRPAPAGGGRPAPAGGHTSPARPAPAPAPPAAGGGASVGIPAPMQGTVVRFLVKPGDRVERAGKVAILEAMKMENDILAPQAGTVAQILVQPGEAVQAGQSLATIEP